MTLVTSRKSLAGLVAAEAAHPIALGLLTPGEAQELLQRRLGHRRATADPGAAAALIDMCARLPLALSIVSARADTSSSTLTDIAVQLHDVRARLDVLDIGDSTTDVRAALSWSYQLLAPGVALMFRLLALHPGPDITPEAAASLAGIPLAEAVQALSDLCQAHMLAEPAPGRYSFHDLLRAYAAELADKHEIQARRAEAAGRILDYYLHTAHKADQLLRPAREDPIVLEPFRPGTRPAGLADEAAALTWLEAEHQVLLAVVTQAFKDGHYTHAWQLAWALDTYLDRRVHWHDYGATQHTALAAAVRISNRDWQARTHQCLGWYFSQLGDHEQAIFHCRRALDLYQHLADMGGQARAYRGLGWVCEQQGRTEEALRYAQLALDLYQSIGHTAGYISALNAVGWLHGLLGDQQQALAHCQRALRLMRLANDDSSKAHTLDSMGHAHHQLGEHDQARLCYRRALRLFRKLGDRYYEAIVLGHLADTCLDAGEPHAAQQAWQRALAILDDLSLPEAEGVRGKLSQLLQSSGQAPDGM